MREILQSAGWLICGKRRSPRPCSYPFCKSRPRWCRLFAGGCRKFWTQRCRCGL